MMSVINKHNKLEEVVFFVNNFGHLVAHHVDFEYTNFIASLSGQKNKSEIQYDIEQCMEIPMRYQWSKYTILDISKPSDVAAPRKAGAHCNYITLRSQKYVLLRLANKQ